MLVVDTVPEFHSVSLSRQLSVRVCISDVQLSGISVQLVMFLCQVLEESFRPDTVLVSIMTVNNEIGVKQPIEQIGE